MLRSGTHFLQCRQDVLFDLILRQEGIFKGKISPWLWLPTG